MVIVSGLLLSMVILLLLNVMGPEPAEAALCQRQPESVQKN
jgi:hypothetical protein